MAKHLLALDDAGLVERVPGAGRAVAYTLRPGALAPAAEWLREAEARWDDRPDRLEATVEGRRG